MCQAGLYCLQKFLWTEAELAIHLSCLNMAVGWHRYPRTQAQPDLREVNWPWFHSLLRMLNQPLQLIQIVYHHDASKSDRCQQVDI